jgi:hypothetical protein
MAAASNVSFDILLGGKVSPEAIKMLNDMEAKLVKFGASTRTVNAVMSRSYKAMFDGISKDGEKAFNKLEHNSKEAFKKLVEHAKEAGKQVKESFEKIGEDFKKLGETIKKQLEFLGISAVLSAVGGALTVEELVKKGIEVHRARETEQNVLAATLRGRGREDLVPGYAEAAERLAGKAPIGHDLAMRMMTRLAATGRFRSPEEAQRMAMSLTGLGGGTTEGAEAALAAYGRLGPMLMAGRVRPTMIAQLGRGGGLGAGLLQQIARDTGIPVTDLAKAFAPAKVSARTGEVTGGALAGAKGIEALNKAILELGESKGFELIKAHMKGMEGLFYRFSEIWENFTDKIGEVFENVISPLGNEISEWLDSIHFDEFFNNLIEKSREWGQMVKNIWDSVKQTPVIQEIQKTVSKIWMAFMGGEEMFGPVVEAWNDNFNHALGTHFERQLTPAGRKFIEGATKNIENVLGGIVKAFQWFVDNHDMVIKSAAAIGVGFAAFGLGTFAAHTLAMGAHTAALLLAAGKGIPNLFRSIPGSPAGKAPFGDWPTAIKGQTAIIPSIMASSLFGGSAIAMPFWIRWLDQTLNQGKNLYRPGAAPTYGATPGMAEAMGKLPAVPQWSAGKAAQQTADQYRAATQVITSSDTLAGSLWRQKEGTNAMHDSLIRANAALDMSVKLLEGHSPGFNPALADATANLNAFVPAMQAAMQAMSAMQFGMGAGGGVSGPGGGVGGDIRAEAYGPSQGEYTRATLFGSAGQRLVQGDYAISPDLAAGHPLFQNFSFMSGGRVMYGRYADASFRTAGVPNYRTIEAWNGADLGRVSNFQWMAGGGLVTGPTRALLGERGPEAVLPLTGNLLSKVGPTVNLSFGNISIGAGGGEAGGESFIREFAETIANEVKRVLEAEHRRSAVV